IEEREKAEQDRLLAEEKSKEDENKDRLAALQESRNNRLKKDDEESKENPQTEDPVTKEPQEEIAKDQEKEVTKADPDKEVIKTDPVIEEKSDTKPEEPQKAKEEEVKQEVDEREDARQSSQKMKDLIEKQRQEAKEESPVIENETEVKETITEKPQEKEPIVIDSKEADNTTEPVRNEVETPVEEVVTPIVKDERTIEELINSDTPKVVKKGNHLLELQNGNYVVAGAFKVFSRAEDFSDEMFNKGYRDVIVGYISETKLYYVVVYQSQDFEKARQQRAAFQQRKGFSKIWLLTVQ
ncbi:MAG: hypothetical protein WBA74_23280, partial [Cyclobacteriaceae bacterium]